MGLLSGGNKSSSTTTTTTDYRTANEGGLLTGDGALTAQQGAAVSAGYGSMVNVTTSDSEVTKAALEAATGTMRDAFGTFDKVFAYAKDAQNLASGQSNSALAAIQRNTTDSLNAVLQAKTDAGQSERILKIVAVAGVILGAVLLLRK